MSNDHDEHSSKNYTAPLFILILLFYVTLSHRLELRKIHANTLWLHESGPAVILGGLLGVIISATTGGNKAVEINGEMFFYAVLPVIIFAQAFGMHKKNF